MLNIIFKLPRTEKFSIGNEYCKLYNKTEQKFSSKIEQNCSVFSILLKIGKFKKI